MNLCVFACKTHSKKKCPSLSRDANVSIIMMLIKTQFSEKKCLVFLRIQNLGVWCFLKSETHVFAGRDTPPMIGFLMY